MGKNKLIKYLLSFSVAGAVFWGNVLSEVQADTLKVEYANPKPAKKGGTLHVGYVNEGAFKGIFAPELMNDGATADVAVFGSIGLFKIDNNYNFVKGGIADISFDKDKKLAEIEISKKARWSDGQPVVARDLVYAYEIIANKDSGSERYTDGLANIEGLEEYHTGKAETVSGLEIKDERHLVIHFKKMVPAMTVSGSGYIWEYAEPYHYLKDVAFKDLAKSDKIRKKPLFYGPYTLSKVVDGEALQWVPNRYYYGKKPQLDKISVETVATAQAATATKSGKYEILLNQNPGIYTKVKEDKSFVQLGKKQLYYTYLGFRVGKLGQDGVSVMDKDAIANDKVLRQAMAYAMNIDQVDQKFGYGLSKRANTVVPVAFGKWNNKKEKGYKFDLKKANALLDKAGYKRQKDGYRVRPDGKKLTLTLLASKSNKNVEASITNYIQQWKKIGVKVKLFNGRFQEFNAMIEKLTAGNATDFDMWFAAWSTASEPTSVASIYTASSPYNVGHFVTKENTELIDSLSSTKAFSEKYRLEQFYKWQAYMNEEAFIVPGSFTTQTVTVAKNVKGMSLGVADSYSLWDSVALTK